MPSVRKRDTPTVAPLSSNTIMYTLPFEIIGFPHNIHSVNVDVLSLNHSNVDCLFYDALSTLICCFSFISLFRCSLTQSLRVNFRLSPMLQRWLWITINLKAFSYQMRCIFSPSVIPMKLFLLLNFPVMAEHQLTIDCIALKKIENGKKWRKMFPLFFVNL